MQVTPNTKVKAVHDKNGCLYQKQNYPPPKPKTLFLFCDTERKFQNKAILYHYLNYSSG